jgi:hypothetical protein
LLVSLNRKLFELLCKPEFELQVYIRMANMRAALCKRDVQILIWIQVNSIANTCLTGIVNWASVERGIPL